MPFEKGISGNTNGRPLGSKNKAAGQLRSLISDFLEQRMEQVIKDFDQLEPKERLRFFIDLLQYGLPKLQAMQIETEFERLPDDQLDYIIQELKNSDGKKQDQ